MKDMLEKIQFYICTVAALVMAVACIWQGVSLVVMVSRLIFIIILFYFLGLIVRAYLKKKVFLDKPEINEAQAEANSEEQPEEDLEEPTDMENGGLL